MMQYENGVRLFLLNVAIGLGTFIQILDTSIANVAIPYISGSLSVSPDQGTWVITSFAASNAIVLPLTGWLSDYFGRVRLFVVSVLLFALASFLCGLSTSLSMLVTLRVIQGAVAGSLIPLSQSLIVTSNPPEKLGGALGFWAMIVVVAPILGPIIGGYITYNYSWPWIFYINVPIGLFSAGIVWFFLRNQESKIVKNPIDWMGLFLLATGVGSLQIMLDKGKNLDWFESNTIIALTIISIIALLYFVLWNRLQKYPIVDLSCFKNRNFTVGTLAITVGYLIFFGSVVIIPLWLQTEQNYTATWAGIAVAPIGVASLFCADWIGKNSKRFDLRKLVALGFLFFSIGFFYQSRFTTDVTLLHIMWARFLQGFGLVFFFLPLIELSLGEISKEKYASASGLFHFIRILVGSGFGTSLAIEFWTRLEIFHHARLSKPLTTYNSLIPEFRERLSNYDSQFTPEVVRGVLDLEVQNQAYMLSTNDLSWLGAWVFFLLIFLPFLCRRVKPQENP